MKLKIALVYNRAYEYGINRNNQPTTAAASNNGHGSNKQTDDRSINN